MSAMGDGDRPRDVSLTDPGTPADLGRLPGASLAAGDDFGAYRILGLVGSGGMGQVYRARDPRLDRQVAIKVLRPGTVGDAGGSRLVREALALAKLAHPNILTVHEIGSVGGETFIATELVDGGTLRDWLRERQRSVGEILAAFAQAGRGLAAAHRAGLVHRDFKPENVLIDADGRARVADFGLVTSPGAAGGVGTPPYMAPEQLAGPVDARSDQYAFCAALYEALAGVRPFAGDTLAELQRAKIDGRVNEPRAGAHAPAWLLGVVARGLDPDPARRHASMDALLALLARDPGAARRRRLTLAATALGAAGTVALALTVARPSDVCAGAARKLAGVWDDAVERNVRAAFVATGRPHAEETFRRMSALLDDYAAAWTAMHVDACAATAKRKEQSPAVLDLRMRCLDGLLVGARALTEVLSQATAEAVDRALPAVAGLGDVATCADAERLAGAPPLPADPELRTRIAAGEVEAAHAEAYFVSGQYRRAREAAGRAVEIARAAGYPPLVARAAFEVAAARKSLGEADAEASVRAAIELANQSRDDALATRAWSMLVDLLFRAGRTAEAEALAFAHDAAVSRGGGDPIQRAWARLGRAQVQYGLGHYDDARRLGEEAIDLFAKNPRPGSSGPRVAENFVGNALWAAGQRDAAIERYRRALALAEAQSGPEHPQVAQVLANLGFQYADMGRTDEARELLSRALAIQERTFGPDTNEVALTLQTLAFAASQADRLDDSVAYVARALAIREKVFGRDAPPTAQTRASYGAALRRVGRTAEAREALELALPIVEKASGPNHPDTAEVLSKLGAVAVVDRRYDDAVRAYARARDILVAAGAAGWQVAFRWVAVGEARCLGGERDAGLADIGKGLALFRADAAPDKYDVVHALTRRAECLLRGGRSGGAVELERALAEPGPPIPRLELARAHAALARSLWLEGRDRARARDLGAAARDVMRTAPHDMLPQLAELETWLARASD
jgi:serine/threonine-protein kinase